MASPVEAQLLAAYGVDPMPEASVRAIHLEERPSSAPRARWLVAAVLTVAMFVAGAVYVNGPSEPAQGTSAAAATTVPAQRWHPERPLPLARNGEALQTIPNARSWFIRTPRDAPIRQPNSRRHPA